MNDTSPAAEAISAAVELLKASPDHRVLRRIGEATLTVPPVPDGVPTRVGVVVDVETTGLDPARDSIIEFAAQRFRFDATGRITALGVARVWREDPGRPLDAAIMKLTGLTDADLAGQMIDTAEATKMLRTAAVIISHHSAFDAPRLEARLPDAAGRAWACTLNDVDWPGLGFDGRGLGYLLAQAGWFYAQHRAEADIGALLHLLAHECPDGTTVLGNLIARAEQPTVRIDAIDTPYSVKDALKARGYAWDPTRRFWWIEVTEAAAEAEQIWLQRNGCHRPPRLTPVTWFERHR